MLWREYAHATAEHVKLLMESQIAVIDRDTARDETLEATIADAGQKRESARTAIREHEAAAHEKNQCEPLPACRAMKGCAFWMRTWQPWIAMR